MEGMTMEPENLTFEHLTIDEARAQAITMLRSLVKVKVSKINNLIRDIERAKNSREVQRIMWNAYMAGTGFGVSGSDWQKFHKGV